MSKETPSPVGALAARFHGGCCDDPRSGVQAARPGESREADPHTLAEARTSTPNFRDLYESHFHLVWRRLLRLGVHERDVADVTQSVFLLAHRKLPQFEGRSTVGTWLTGFCIRVAKDWRGSAHQRREVLAGDSAKSDHRPAKGDAHQALEHGRRVQLMHQILATLSEDQRTVFVLYELEEMTGDEIADALRIPVGTVWSRLRLGREAFRAALARAAQASPGGR